MAFDEKCKLRHKNVVHTWLAMESASYAFIYATKEVCGTPAVCNGNCKLRVCIRNKIGMWYSRGLRWKVQGESLVMPPPRALEAPHALKALHNKTIASTTLAHRGQTKDRLW